MRAIPNPTPLIIHRPYLKSSSFTAIIRPRGAVGPSSSTQFSRACRFSTSRSARSYFSALCASAASSQAQTESGGVGRPGALTPPPVTEVPQKIDVNPPKGTRDFPPEQMRLRNWLFEVLGSAGEAIDDFKYLFSLAEKFGYSDWIQFDASVVRGLAYYTGIVFEGFDRQGKLRAICGGGRYDRLLSTLGGDDIPACGFGFGDAVMVELLKEKGILPELNLEVENIVCALDQNLQGAASSVAAYLRGKGQAVDLVLENKPPKWVFKAGSTSERTKAYNSWEFGMGKGYGKSKKPLIW